MEIIASDPSICNTLEIGCAFGMSALYICGSTAGRPNARHTILDPWQESDWNNAGVNALREAGIAFAQCLHERSEFYLPKLAEATEGSFDLVFVDGDHKFDHVLIDCFYSTKLLRIGRFLVLDDTWMEGISRVADYLRAYPCFQEFRPTKRPRRFTRSLLPPALVRRLYKQPTMVAFKKVSQDERRYDWFTRNF